MLSYRMKMCWYRPEGICWSLSWDLSIQSHLKSWTRLICYSKSIRHFEKGIKKIQNDQLCYNGSVYLFVLDALIAIVLTHSVENRHAHIHAPTRRHIWNNHTLWHSEHVKNQEDMKQSISVVQSLQQQNNTNYPKPSHSVRKCRRPWVPVCRANKNRSRSSLCMRLIHL